MPTGVQSSTKEEGARSESHSEPTKLSMWAYGRVAALSLCSLALAACQLSGTPSSSNNARDVAEPTTSMPNQPHSEGEAPDARAPRQLVTANWHTCALSIAGGVSCWGSNASGELGDGTNETSRGPVRVQGLDRGVVEIGASSASRSSMCALSEAGDVSCWGDNSHGQLGDGTTENRASPVRVVGLESDATDLAVGSDFACVLTTSGGVKCWGRNMWGQLGDGTNTDRPKPVDVLGLSSGVDRLVVNGAASYICAVKTSGGVACWGRNRFGAKANEELGSILIPTGVQGLGDGVKQVSVARQHACAVMADGGAKCWGTNSSAQLGDGRTEDTSVAVAVTGLVGPVERLALGRDYSCAQLQSGAVMCWGENEYGQLGDGTTTARQTPTLVGGLANVTDIAVGRGAESPYTCAITDAGALKCWGGNDDGQLGDGTADDRSSPVDVLGGASGFVSLTLGVRHGCAITNEQRVGCWGVSVRGQLGGGLSPDGSVPVDVLTLSDVASIRAAGEHTCALTKDGGVACWGDNQFGQIGDGTKLERTRPTQVIGLKSGVKQLLVETNHNCAWMDSGEAQCWGWNVFGQLGEGTTADRAKPSKVKGLSKSIAQLVINTQFGCAVLESGALECWGAGDYGQLGNGKSKNTPKASAASLVGANVEALALGGFHACALEKSGDVACWGYNISGQVGVEDSGVSRPQPTKVAGLSGKARRVVLGVHSSCALTQSGLECWGAGVSSAAQDGALIDSREPVKIQGVEPDVVGLLVGGRASCALMGDGGVKCWGENAGGQLGDGTLTPRAKAADVDGLTAGVQQLAGNGVNFCAVLETGHARCWGDNSYGQLGDGTSETSPVPVEPRGLGAQVQMVTVGSSHACALMTSGGVKCWGTNRFGQRGDGVSEHGSKLGYVQL